MSHLKEVGVEELWPWNYDLHLENIVWAIAQEL